jgi:ribosome recycling factor
VSLDLDDILRRMNGAIDSLSKEFSGLRTGRASTALLENISIDAYGAKMALSQVGSISIPEPRLLTVQVWDNSLIKEVEKSIRDSNLGLNPQTEGNLIRIPVPDLSEERRVDLTKVAARFGEQARVSVRNVRRVGMDTLKKSEKESEISKDEQRDLGEDIQKLTDEHITIIDKLLVEKEQEILQV